MKTWPLLLSTYFAHYPHPIPRTPHAKPIEHATLQEKLFTKQQSSPSERTQIIQHMHRTENGINLQQKLEFHKKRLTYTLACLY